MRTMSTLTALRTALAAGALFVAVGFTSDPALGNHQVVYINGQLIDQAMIDAIQQQTGVVLSSGAYSWDGEYLYDARGNYVPLSLGGGYSGGGGYYGGGGGYYGDGGGGYYGGGGGGSQTDIIIDPSGGCEGGSCVNILD